MPVVRGRGLTPRDSQPGEESVVVNQRFADLYFKDSDPIGRQIRMASPAPAAQPLPPLRIVGVTASMPRLARREAPPDPVVYAPWQTRSRNAQRRYRRQIAHGPRECGLAPAQ